MQLESHATPSQESPQHRYANLHRAIERGLDSEEIWKDLAHVCLELGHQDEAVRCLRRMPDGAARLALASKLTRLGLVAEPVKPSQPARHPAPAAHPAAPAASDAGAEPVAKQTTEHRFDAASLREHVGDAFEFVFQQHMPWLVLVTTLAFPLLVGLGGFLTAGGSPLLLTGLAALPGLCVLAVVGAMGRRLLVESSQGNGDVPPIPELGVLVTEARRFLADAVLVLGSLLGPSVFALALGAPLLPTLPGLVLGSFFTPLAWGLRQVRGDLGALSPVTLLRGAGRTGIAYVALAVVCLGLFAPAALVAIAVCSRPVWVQIAVLGPLVVLPLFVASRLIGTWLDAMRLELGMVLLGPQGVRPRREPAPTQAPAREEAPAAPAAERPRMPRRPDALQHFEAPSQKRAAAPAPKPAPTARGKRPAKPAAPAKPAPKQAPKQAATDHPAHGTAPNAEPRAIEGRSPRALANEAPDLRNMPGATVVKGSARRQVGAAATRPR